jgi:hypothetical protein
MAATPRTWAIASPMASHGWTRPVTGCRVCYPQLLPTGRISIAATTVERQKPPDYQGFCLKRMKGFEPSTFAMARRRSSQLSYIRKVQPF